MATPLVGEVVYELPGWTGNAVDEAGVLWKVNKETGWSAGLNPRSRRSPRPSGHGTTRSRPYGEERLITLTGVAEAPTPVAREEAKDRFTALLSGPDLEQLVVHERHMSRQAAVELNSDPRVTDLTPVVFEWQLTLAAPDPRRYALEPVSPSPTPLQQPGGGVAPPWTPPLFLPARAAGGAQTVTNPGTAPAPVLIMLKGPQVRPGVLNATTNQVLRYGLTLDDDDELVIDTDRGVAILNGTAYRGPEPGSTVTQLFELPPGISSDLQAVGEATGSGTPTMGVLFFPAWW
ncbi:phage tail domain-containing protein [Blastococcus sp. CT_GayMR16]|uniref:phage tail domain-containing protein n=1 Tax=Blastococcus sp. CT_GayMR16 TaxID=2559607 RepID=UPI001073C969|nr:phage tail domain-containing protein [Blastococcus sp. CT_GayMR16]TFV83163.1 phage tail protein [Blastococcus sp. CT_GayMR16]